MTAKKIAREIINYLVNHKSQLMASPPADLVAHHTLSMVTAIVENLAQIASIEAKRLNKGFTQEDQRNIDHLQAQLLQRIDIMLQKTPMEVLAWVIHAIFLAALKL